MLLFEGAHGTTVCRAGIIRANGFKASKGRGGTGAYFWRKGHHSKDLAIGWWALSNSKNRYHDDTNRNCAIIHVKLHVQDEEHLNLEDPGLRDKVATLAEQRGIRNDNQIAGLFDFFIKELEKAQGVQFRVISIRVAPPPQCYCPNYSIKISGAPYCYVARDVACIEIDNIEENVR
jgi:hypothetical protein